ncbi:uncharacterized protein N7503_001068 [Penicillium pulvis]|uniref:uncharacterized protein n=1 Tax=Penicillium pulvis TaxID=1562058 RepID=UPI00254993A2|nr:uncharacterized protein N7503_001068 [Penicillium pulvis]KAJ5814318.1 hypothetical protein N7503_001068 [Penicillium pulvis]
MSQCGLSVWTSPENATFDIVFVHGLRGHPEKTWTKDDILWPLDLLASDAKQCRIMSFGYDSAIVYSDTAHNYARDGECSSSTHCSTRTDSQRKNQAKRPILLVAHSLGGLVCATAIVLGDRSAKGDSIETIARHVQGMIFFGTPFGGSNLAKWGDLIRRVFDAVKKTDRSTLKTLQADSNDLKLLRTEFPDVIRKRNAGDNKVKIFFFFEELDTYGQRVVEEHAASYQGLGEILPLRSDHLDMCKFTSKEDVKYKVVKAKIMDVVLNVVKLTPPESGSHIFYNYDKVINQFGTGGSMHIENQTFNFG